MEKQEKRRVETKTDADGCCNEAEAKIVHHYKGVGVGYGRKNLGVTV